MKSRFTAVVAAVVLGVAAPVSSAMAFTYDAPVHRIVPHAFDDDLTTGSIGAGTSVAPRTGWCVPSSASEGNANQQTRPVMQYGQTAGGSRC